MRTKDARLDELPAPPPGWVQRPAGVSLCMIVRDEEQFLGEALASVRGVVDEICIVDTGSVDRTLQIARDAGARIVETAWEDDFSKARNMALEMARRRWILVLDADERLSPSSREVVIELARRPAYLTGMWTRCYNFTEDYKGTGAMSNALVRIFPNHERIRYRNPIHEFVALDGNQAGMPAIVSNVEIIHLGYSREVMRARRKDERNLALAEAALRKDPEDAFNWYNYATSSLLAGQAATAVSALEKMRELHARAAAQGGRLPSFVPNGLSLLASLYLNEGRDAAKAEVVAREIIAQTQTFADAHFLLGKSLAAQRRFAEARQALIAAIEDGKSSHLHPFVDNEIPLWKAHSEIGATLIEEQKYDLALAWFEFALKARPKVQPVRINQARALEAVGRYDEARAVLSAVWEDDRDDLAANEYLNFLLRRGDERGALGFIEAVAEELPPETRLIMYGSAAVIASRLGEPGAERYLERALNVAGVDDRRERLRALMGHFNDAGMLALLERGSLAG